nr:hypothetical protein [Mycobacteroides abscessus]
MASRFRVLCRISSVGAVVAAAIAVPVIAPEPDTGTSPVLAIARADCPPDCGGGPGNGGTPSGPPGGGTEFVPPSMPAIPSYEPGRGQPPLDQNNGISIYNSAAPQPSQAAQPTQPPVQNQDGSYNRAANSEQQPVNYNNAPGNQEVSQDWQNLSNQLNQQETQETEQADDQESTRRLASRCTSQIPWHQFEPLPSGGIPFGGKTVGEKTQIATSELWHITALAWNSAQQTLSVTYKRPDGTSQSLTLQSGAFNENVGAWEFSLDGDKYLSSRGVATVTCSNIEIKPQGIAFFCPPANASSAELVQFMQYIDAANRANDSLQLSPTGRTRQEMMVMNQNLDTSFLPPDLNFDIYGKRGMIPLWLANVAAREAEKRAHPERYTGGLFAGHAPDSTWRGKADAFEWIPMTLNLNSSLAGQNNRFALGFSPTRFAQGVGVGNNCASP